MARLTVRYLVEKPGRAGQPKFFWQPSAGLRAAGWHAIRLPDDRARAVAEAERRNRDLDAWRAGQAPDATPAPVRGQPQSGTVAALIGHYRVSRHWQGTATTPPLADSTKRQYLWAFDLIDGWAGDAPVRSITPPLVQAFYETLLARPAKAAAAVRVLRLLLAFGRRAGWVAENAAEKPATVNLAPRAPVLWSPAQVRHMATVADALGWRSIGTAILLNEWLGQREGDVLALPRFDVAAGALVFRQSKRGRLVSLPVRLVPHLVARLQAEDARPGTVLHPALLLVHDRTGQAWNEHTFRHAFAECRAAAARGSDALRQVGLEPVPSCAALQFMTLRHTAIVRLKEAGVEDLDVALITGQSPKGIRDLLDRHYLVQTEKGAARVFRQRLAAEWDEAGSKV